MSLVCWRRYKRLDAQYLDSWLAIRKIRREQPTIAWTENYEQSFHDIVVIGATSISRKEGISLKSA